MSFFDKLSSGAKHLNNAVQEQKEMRERAKERCERFEDQLSSKSDAELKKIYKDDGFFSDMEKRRAAARILKSRGY